MMIYRHRLLTDEIVEIDTPAFREDAEEYKYCLQQKKIFEERANAARGRLLSQCDGLQKYEGWGLVINYHYRKQFDKAWLAKGSIRKLTLMPMCGRARSLPG